MQASRCFMEHIPEGLSCLPSFEQLTKGLGRAAAAVEHPATGAKRSRAGEAFKSERSVQERVKRSRASEAFKSE
ncbi:Protein of unknown function [Gryllus bimaculatus]|nr:Protein of unknown function [Gryllus bimaculatus]